MRHDLLSSLPAGYHMLVIRCPDWKIPCECWPLPTQDTRTQSLIYATSWHYLSCFISGKAGAYISKIPLNRQIQEKMTDTLRATRYAYFLSLKSAVTSLPTSMLSTWISSNSRTIMNFRRAQRRKRKNLETQRKRPMRRTNSQRKSITRRPSERRPVDLRKKVRPLGRQTGKPSPATSPPVSELESPKLKRIGGLLILH